MKRYYTDMLWDPKADAWRAFDVDVPVVRHDEAQAIIDEAVGLLDAWEDHDFRVCAEVDPEDEPPCGDCYMCRTRDFIAKHGKNNE